MTDAHSDRRGLVTAVAVVTVVSLLVVSLVGGGIGDVVFVAPGHGEHDPEDADEIYENPTHEDLQGEVFWQGQVVMFTGLEPGAEYTLREGTPGDDEFAGELVADENGAVVLDTAAYDEGHHYVEGVFEYEGEPAQFQLVEQWVDASIEPDEVQHGEDVELELRSNRGTYPVHLSSDAADAGTLADAVDGATYDEEEGKALLSAGSDAHEIDTQVLPEEALTVEVAVADSAATAAANVSVTERPDDAVTLVEQFPRQERGDPVTVEYEVDGETDTELRIGDEGANFEVGVDVAVADRDEPVAVEVNTYEIARADVDSNDTVVVDNADEYEVAIHSEPFEGDTRLEAGSYAIEVTAGDDRAAGTLWIDERGVGDATAHVAPADASLDDPDDVHDAMTEREEVAQGDHLVIQANATGLYGFAFEDGDLVTEEGVDFWMAERGAGPHSAPEQFPLAMLPDDALSFAPDPDEDRFFVVVDTAELDGDGPTGAELKPGTEYQATFSLHYHNDYVAIDELDEVARTELVVEEPVVEFEADPVTVEAGPDQSVSGTSTLAPGTEFTVVAEGVDEPVIEHRTAEVGADGTWEVTFEDAFVDLSEDAEFELEALNTGETVDGVIDD